MIINGCLLLTISAVKLISVENFVLSKKRSQNSGLSRKSRSIRTVLETPKKRVLARKRVYQRIARLGASAIGRAKNTPTSKNKKLISR